METKKQDCFAYKPKECVAMREQKCEYCNFFKTKAQHNADIAKAEAMITPYEREHVYAKYYVASKGGKK